MCMQTMPLLNTDEFSEKVLQVINGGAISLMISIGHRTGLFDTMAELPPSDSRRIADAADLSERYVREWLGAVVSGGIVQYDEQARTYHLPEPYAAVLTRAAGASNMASIAQWVSVLGSVEDRIVECFEKGGGVHYSEYRRFHPVMAEESGQNTVSALEESILPLVPGLPERLRQGIEVLDIGCGSGRAILEMARLYPASRFTGYDLFTGEALEAATAEARKQGLTNVKFVVQDAAQMTDVERFDLIMAFDIIHDQAHPDIVLDNINRALKHGGDFLVQDIRSSSELHRNGDNPLAPFIYTISCMHCMTVSLAQGGMGLGAAWGEELALQMLREAGFDKVVTHQLPHDILNNYYITRRD